MSNRADTYNRADNAATVGTPSDAGSNPTIQNGGTFGIRNNRVYLVSGSDTALLYESGSTNVQVSAKVYNTLCGVCFRGRYVAYYNSDTAVKISEGAGAVSFADIVTLTSQPSISGPGSRILALRQKPSDATKLELLVDGSVVHERAMPAGDSGVTKHGYWQYGGGVGYEGDDLAISDQNAFTGGTLSESLIRTTSARVAWTSSTNGTGGVTEQLQKSAVGANVWSNVSAQTASPGNVSGLSANTQYDLRVAYTDTTPSTVYSNTLTITTLVDKFVYFEGDSNTYGQLASLNQGTVLSPTYPGVALAALGASWTGINGGHSGDQIADLTSDAADVDDHYDAGRSQNILAVMIGTNDLGTGSKNATTLTAAVKTYCLARQGAGWGVVLVRPPSCNYSGNDIDAALASYATLCLADPTFYDSFVDLGNNHHIGDAGDYNDTTYFHTDKIHLVDAGLAEIGADVAAAITTLTTASLTASGTIEVGAASQTVHIVASNLDITSLTAGAVTPSAGTVTNVINITGDASSGEADLIVTGPDSTSPVTYAIAGVTSTAITPLDTTPPVADAGNVPAAGTTIVMNFDEANSAAMLPTVGIVPPTFTVNGAPLSIASSARTGSHQYTFTVDGTIYAGEGVSAVLGSCNITDGSGNGLIFPISPLTLSNDSTQTLLTATKVGGGNLEAGPGGQGDQTQTVELTSRGINMSAYTLVDVEQDNGFVDSLA
jgi:lysophospholipase L1-like esterase